MKYFVEFYSYETGREVIFGRALLEKGEERVKFEGIPDKMILGFHERGITKDGKNFVFPNDGLKFLETLNYAVSGSMIRASVMKKS